MPVSCHSWPSWCTNSKQQSKKIVVLFRLVLWKCRGRGGIKPLQKLLWKVRTPSMLWLIEDYWAIAKRKKRKKECSHEKLLQHVAECCDQLHLCTSLCKSFPFSSPKELHYLFVSSKICPLSQFILEQLSEMSHNLSSKVSFLKRWYQLSYSIVNREGYCRET